jgi:hypothetical protein
MRTQQLHDAVHVSAAAAAVVELAAAVTLALVVLPARRVQERLQERLQDCRV